MPISCWLLPPEPNRTVLHKLIAETAQQHGLPIFAPHLTLLGSIGDIPTEDALKKLQSLAGSGTVPVCFTAVESRPPWNQYAVAVAEETAELCRAQRLARQAFHGKPSAEADVTWAPPLEKPHLTLAYGADPNTQSAITAALPLPQGFLAAEVGLYECTPATLEGVPGWKEVGRVAL